MEQKPKGEASQVPEVKDIKECSVLFLYTEIGRGHPAYLDGIIEVCEANYTNIKFHKTDVFTLSSGLSLKLWKIIRAIYYLGARGGVVSSLYNQFRKSVKPGRGDSLLFRLMGKKIIERLKGFSGLIIVAHPVLAQILGSRFNVIYQHGELVVPDEAIVKNCLKIIVPLKTTAKIFENSEIPSNDISIVGQCIENNIVLQSENSVKKRLDRLKSAKIFRAALFSSGAHPPSHINKIILIAESLIKHGHKVTIFTGDSLKFNRKLTSYFSQKNIEYSDALNT
jgi:hypothetical protein